MRIFGSTLQIKNLLLHTELLTDKVLILNILVDVEVVRDHGFQGHTRDDLMGSFIYLVEMLKGDMILFEDYLQKDRELLLCLALKFPNPIDCVGGVLLHDKLDLLEFMLFGEWCGLAFLCTEAIGELFIFIGFPELLHEIFIMLGHIFPTFHVAYITHSDLFFVVTDFFPIEEVIRASVSIGQDGYILQKIWPQLRQWCFLRYRLWNFLSHLKQHSTSLSAIHFYLGHSWAFMRLWVLLLIFCIFF